MAGNSNDSYIWNRDYKSSIRLNYLHTILTNLFGDQLLPDALRSRLPSLDSLRVADIGTGTAIWPIELSSALPETCRIDGFDISTTQYPPNKEWLPQNVALHEHDAFKPFPVEHIGVYDIVHIRSFVTLLNENNVKSFLENVATLLKPGGFLQWLDYDPFSSKPWTSPTNTEPIPNTEFLAGMMRGAQSGSDSWIPRSSSPLEDAGLEPTAYDRRALHGHYQHLNNQVMLLGLEEVVNKLEQSPESRDKADALRQRLADLSQEFARGATLEVDFFLMVGQKK